MVRKENEEKKEVSISHLINSAANEGFELLFQNHPKFRESRELFSKNLDKEKLEERERKIYKQIQYRQDWPNEKKIKYIKDEMRNYVASGLAFNQLGQSLLMNKGLEGKIEENLWDKTKEFFSGQSESEKTLQESLNTFEDLYALTKSGNFSEMPEVQESIIKGKSAGAVYMAANVLKYNKKIDDSDYRYLTRQAKKTAEREIDKTKLGLEKYVTPEKYQKVIAFMLGIIGLLIVLLPGTKITGNVTSSLLNNTASGIAGVLFLIASLALYMKSSKK